MEYTLSAIRRYATGSPVVQLGPDNFSTRLKIYYVALGSGMLLLLRILIIHMYIRAAGFLRIFTWRGDRTAQDVPHRTLPNALPRRYDGD